MWAVTETPDPLVLQLSHPDLTEPLLWMPLGNSYYISIYKRHCRAQIECHINEANNCWICKQPVLDLTQVHTKTELLAHRVMASNVLQAEIMACALISDLDCLHARFQTWMDRSGALVITWAAVTRAWAASL